MSIIVLLKTIVEGFDHQDYRVKDLKILDIHLFTTESLELINLSLKLVRI